jgi:secreted PhoX family phosphatase
MSSKTIDKTAPATLNRRGFLRVSALGSGAMVFGSGALLTACDPVGLKPADANGIRVAPGFTARVVATTDQEVASTGYTWHLWPDGGACFDLPGGGWSYVSNSEWFTGGPGGAGASFIEFDAGGNIVNAGRCLSGTVRNCSGGITPWGTWLSCEETVTGSVWECDPLGAVPAIHHPGMGRFVHEAAACHPVEEVVYLTEDRPDGAFYRFVPTVWGDLSAGVLEVMTEAVPGTLAWATVPDPNGDPLGTRDQVADTKRFDGGEGIDLSGNNVVFATKGDNRVWSYDPVANALTVLYDAAVNVNAVLTGVDNVETSAAGVIYVCEDGGDMQIVLVREDGSTFPVMQIVGNSGSEICGAAFDSSGKRLYFSDQRNPGRTIEVSGSWGIFTDPGPLI